MLYNGSDNMIKMNVKKIKINIIDKTNVLFDLTDIINKLNISQDTNFQKAVFQQKQIV